ncbi:MAG: hypothetical protein KIT14_10940 [bacterium]|nr:hypothetical protein [bacterium]
MRRLEGAHREYVDAQRRVDAAEAALDAARVRVRELRAVQGDALETLACTLVVDGHGRKNPFAAFGAPSPGTIGRLAVTDGAAAIARLVEAVMRRSDASPRSVQAARAALDAACAVEQAVEAIARLEDDARAARVTRDALGVSWDAALAALQSKARAAADDGAPHLYATPSPPTRRRMRRGAAHDPAPGMAGGDARDGR